MASVDTSRLIVDNTGRTSFSGLTSGIDWQAAVDAMVKAKHVSIDKLTSTITSNSDKIKAYTDLGTKVSAMRDAIDKLRGAISADKSSNIFLNKQSFATSARDDIASLLYNPNRTVASNAGDIVGVTVNNVTATGNYTVEVLRTAKAHKISSKAFTSSSTALNTLMGGFTGGTFQVGGKTVSIDANNTLADVRDRINAANAGVTASILSASPTENYLILTNNNTGVAMTFDATTSDVLEDLQLTNAGSVPTNVLQAPQTAQFTANGLRDQSRKRSDIIYNPGATLDTLAPGQITAGSMSFEVISGGIPFMVDYDKDMSVNQLITAINNAASVAGSDVTASLETVQGGNGGYRLILKDASGDNVTLQNDIGGLFTAMNFTDPKIIERTSNTVSDLVPGMTLNLYKAEGGTVINIDVEQNLSDVKTQIANFVSAYNDLVVFMNKQVSVDPATGKPLTDADGNPIGTLFNSSTLADVKSLIGDALSTATAGVSKDFSALGNIGVSFIDNKTAADSTLYNTMKIDEKKLDESLLNNPEDVRKLFTFDGSTNDSRFTITGFDGAQSYIPGGLAINFVHNGTTFTSADIGGDSSAVEIVNGNTLKIKSGPGKGMVIYYTGGASSGSVTASYTVGVGAKLFSAAEKIMLSDTGTIDNEVNTLKNLNKVSEDRITTLSDRIEAFRQQQLTKFQKMEAAMSSSKSILDMLKQSSQQNNNN